MPLGDKLLDLTDIHIEVPRVDYEKLSGDRMGGDQRVDSQTCASGAQYSTTTLCRFAVRHFVSTAYHRILKRARTIADLTGSEDSQSVHLAEALQYRPKLMIG